MFLFFPVTLVLRLDFCPVPPSSIISYGLLNRLFVGKFEELFYGLYKLVFGGCV